MVKTRRATDTVILALGILLTTAAMAVAATSPTTVPLGDAAIEFLSGSKLNGRIAAVSEDSLTIVTKSGTREITRKYPVDRIHAVTVGGSRYVLNKASASSSTSGTSRRSSSSSVSGSQVKRSKAEIEALIDNVGRTPPDWYDSVPLEYPQSLDLSWPQPPEKQWNNQKNVGQYIWDIINPNPGKWKSGIRFLHFMLEKHAQNAELRTRIMQSIGGMYFNFFRDYPRAAFWLQAAGADRTQSPQSVRLAECYWRMGNDDMAKELLNKLPLYYQTIKLWADMGETDKALRVATAFHQSGYTDMAYLSAGDACRTVGKLDDAVSYYENVLKLKPEGKTAERTKRNQQRARANIEGIKLYDSLDLSRVPDGKFSGMAPGYAGDLFIEVTVASGRIQSVVVTRHKEKQFYSAINDTTAQIVDQQGFSGIDATTGATITSEAIINATAKALAGAVK